MVETIQTQNKVKVIVCVEKFSIQTSSHSIMTAADSEVVLLELDVQWD